MAQASPGSDRATLMRQERQTGEQREWPHTWCLRDHLHQLRVQMHGVLKATDLKEAANPETGAGGGPDGGTQETED